MVKHAKVGDIVYHVNDKLKENAYIVVLRDTVTNKKGEKIYKYLVNPITNGRQDKTITIYFYEFSLVPVSFIKGRSTKLITERLLFNRNNVTIQWGYPVWKNILNGFEKGMNIVRFTDTFGDVIYATIRQCETIMIPNCNDRKDNCHSFIPRIRITIGRLL